MSTLPPPYTILAGPSTQRGKEMFAFNTPRTYTCLRCSRDIISPLDDLCLDVDRSTLCLWCYNHHVVHREESLSSHLLSQILSLLYRLEKEGKWLK